MKLRIANWHGEQAGNAYRDWTIWGRKDDLERYLRHVSIADRMWR